MIEGMAILGYDCVVEKWNNGWRHALLLQDKETRLYIVDDTEAVIVRTDNPNFPLSRAVEIWRNRLMGTSTFGCDLADDLKDRALYKRSHGLNHVLYEGSSVQFSHLDEEKHESF